MAEFNPDLTALNVEARAFVAVLDELHGLYLDAIAGFAANLRLLEKGRQLAASEPGSSPTDESAFFFSDGEPGTPTNVMLHQTTQGAFIARNSPAGSNYVRLAQMLIVLAFEYWETEYRRRIAIALGIADTNDLKVPPFGDLRLLRNDVIHGGGIVSDTTATRLESLGKVISVTPGTMLALGPNDVRALIFFLKRTIDTMVVKAGGVDPQHGAVRSVM